MDKLRSCYPKRCILSMKDAFLGASFFDRRGKLLGK